MGEPKTPNEKPDGEKKPGKYHYNPVNMSGKEVGIIEELDEKQEKEAEKERKSGPDADKSKES